MPQPPTIACTACPLLCGIAPAPSGPIAAVAALAACGHASGWIPEAVRRQAEAADRGPQIAGRPAALAEAVAEAADRLVAARRVLVTGLPGLSLEGIRAAAACAERLGAAFDTGSADASSPAGPTLARVGGVTADWEELRDRADLVLLLAVDPSVTHPRFVERFLTPRVEGRPRRVLLIGPSEIRIDGLNLMRLPLTARSRAEAARLLEAAVSGGMGWGDLAARLGLSGEDGRAIEAWFSEARCVAVVHGVASRPEAGGGETPPESPAVLEWLAVAGLVRALAHRGPAFAIPLGAGATGGGPNGAAAAAVATWRYGAAGGIARADATGGRFLPGEADGRTLAARGEVDLVLVAGVRPAWLEGAPGASPRGPVGILQVGPPAGGPPGPAPFVTIPTAWPGLDDPGTLLREDGRSLRAAAWFDSGLPSAVDVLRALENQLAARAGARERPIDRKGIA
jgi:formylmethanofuran dehydrogenase subunit B